ncbi:UPF0746 protein DDB_G0281095-like isoform X2 [Odontomachus brunneus]|uniref:UPF0746 protein DDB_G0281095-like isoform X2 n=1 Tax=Odontomachus brunneus TaxID=486640 RepID=UPI0013F1EE34|nr:UPF0746 protein DDB_G0281095-like isoform X2 [Odontomachus brunneus]
MWTKLGLNMDFLMEFLAYCIRLKNRIIKYLEQICRPYNEEEEWYPDDDPYSMQLQVFPSTSRQHQIPINMRMAHVTTQVILTTQEQQEQKQEENQEQKRKEEQKDEENQEQERKEEQKQEGETEHISKQSEEPLEERNTIFERPLETLFVKENRPRFKRCKVKITSKHPKFPSLPHWAQVYVLASERREEFTHRTLKQGGETGRPCR